MDNSTTQPPLKASSGKSIKKGVPSPFPFFSFCFVVAVLAWVVRLSEEAMPVVVVIYENNTPQTQYCRTLGLDNSSLQRKGPKSSPTSRPGNWFTDGDVPAQVAPGEEAVV